MVFVRVRRARSIFVIPTEAPPHFVIPAEAGIHLLLLLTFDGDAKTDSRPCVIPSAILAAGSLSLLAQRK
jgi:hypothetical protein